MARPIAKDHGDKRRMILKGAARVFASEGFDRASVVQVAQACGVSKANLYHYYSSKNDILFDILDSYLAELRDRVCGLDIEWLRPRIAFERSVRDILLAYEGSDDEHRLQISAINQLPPEQQATLRSHQLDIVHQMEGLIEAIAPEKFAGDAGKLRSVTMSVFGMLNWFYMWNPNADERTREDYANTVCKLTLDGLSGV